MSNLYVNFYQLKELKVDSINNMIIQNNQILEETKEKLKEMNLEYKHYSNIIKNLKDEENNVASILEKLKNKEYEEIESLLSSYSSNIRKYRLELEKEQKDFKSNFLIAAKDKIKDELIINIFNITNSIHNIKSNYHSFIDNKVDKLLEQFKGVHGDSLNTQLDTIITDLPSLYTIYELIFAKIMDDVNDTDFLNLGMVFNFDYNQPKDFDLKNLIKMEQEKIALINQKQKEKEERDAILQKQQKEKEAILEQQKKKQQEDNFTKGMETHKETINNIINRVDNINNKIDDNSNQDISFISKEYLFANDDAMKQFNKFLAENCRVKIQEVNGKKRNIIIGFIE